MARKSALDRIDAHEKLCRIMQKQTFQQIQELKERIAKLEKYIMGAAFAIIMAVLMNPFK